MKKGQNSFLDKFNDAYSTPDSELNASSLFVLPGSGKSVNLKAFTSGDQKTILKSLEEKNLIKADADMDKILRRLTGVDPLSLLSADRHALIIKLREVTLGSDVDYRTICDNQKCGHAHEVKLSLQDFECSSAKSLDEEKLKVNENITFVLGYAVRGDEIDLSNYMKFTAKKVKGEDDAYSSTELRFGTYAIIIKKVIFKKGEDEEVVVPRFQDKIEMLSTLSMDDSEKIVKYIKSQEDFGYNLEIYKVACPSCGNVYSDSIEWVTLFIK
jgi:hypothetical protein